MKTSKRRKKSLDRLELLQEMYNMATHNLLCYSKNCLMTKPNPNFEKEWNREQEKLETINEMIEEERNNNFHVYSSLYNLRNNIEERLHMDLAYLENRDKQISCYLTIDEFDEKNNPNYILVFSLHKKDAFDDEYENIYTRYISKDAFADRETLRKEMQYALDIFEGFIEVDKKFNRVYSKFYEDEETEELE